MNKKIEIKDHNKKLSIMCYAFFGGISASERTILSELINTSTNNSIVLNGEISGQICQSLNMSAAAFSIALFRLEKKGVIKKSGKSITLHPVLNNINELDTLIISFSHP